MLWEILYNFFDVTTVRGLVSGLVSTIIGVALGIPVALLINKQIEAITEKEKKRRILNSLNIELSIIRMAISFWKDRGKQAEGMANLGMSLHDEGWKAFSDGGELQWIRDPMLLHLMSSAYGRLGYVRLLSEKYFDIVTFRKNSTATIARTVAQDLRNAIDRLDEKIEEALTEIGLHQADLLKKSWFERMISFFRRDKGVYISD